MDKSCLLKAVTLAGINLKKDYKLSFGIDLMVFPRMMSLVQMKQGHPPQLQILSTSILNRLSIGLSVTRLGYF